MIMLLINWVSFVVLRIIIKLFVAKIVVGIAISPIFFFELLVRNWENLFNHEYLVIDMICSRRSRTYIVDLYWLEFVVDFCDNHGC